MEFVHLHNHTEYSIMDAIPHPAELAQAAKKNAQRAVAITDHGNLYGAFEFYKVCREVGVKPIIGCELYFVDDREKKGGSSRHILLLAKDWEGYKNLSRLVSLANTVGFWHTPRIDWRDLERHHKGLICATACLKGVVNSSLLKGDFEAAEVEAAKLKELFGEDFYLEEQWHNLSEDKILVPRIKELAHRLGVKIIPTVDVHYLEKEDARYHTILYKITSPSRTGLPTDEFYFKSTEEVWKIFGEDCLNTIEIAEKVNFEFPMGQNLMPKISEDADKELEERVFRGLKLLYGDSKGARKRAEYELKIIKQMGFSDYFLIVADFVNWAKENGIWVGPGRGSAAGSIVAYALGITEVDPLKFGLLFERFLNPERVSMPDIDVDFEDARRKEVVEYLFERYGEENTAQIITFDKMAARQVIRDVGRALGRTVAYCDRIAKQISFGQTLSDFLEKNPQYLDLTSDEADPELFEAALKLEGRVRNSSVHAAGVVISSHPIVDYVPLRYAEREGKKVTVTQFSKDYVEEIGLLKMDVLGLETLTELKVACNFIEKMKGQKLDLKSLPLDDRKTYEMISRGDTTGVFQLESHGARNLVKRMKPENIYDLMAAIALYRPGPLQGGMVDEYIARKHGQKEVNYIHPALEDVLKETYGVIVYQEQVMMIANRIAGFTLGEADLLRRAMGKKKKEVMEQLREKFIRQAKERGVDEEKAKEIYDLIYNFADYGFNKSHSAAYALISYYTAYIKAHYPAEFYASLMTIRSKKTEKLAIAVESARRDGIEVLKPCINHSYAGFVVEGNAVRFGLAGIKSVGDELVKEIVEERQRAGEYKGLVDFCSRIDPRFLNKKSLEALIKAGAFDFTGKPRKALLMVAENAKRMGERLHLSRRGGIGLFGMEVGEIDVPEIEKNVLEELLWEKEFLGVYLSANPMDVVFKRKEEVYEWVKPVEYMYWEEGEERIGEEIWVCGVVEAVARRRDRWEIKLSDGSYNILVRYYGSKRYEVGDIVVVKLVVRQEGVGTARKILRYAAGSLELVVNSVEDAERLKGILEKMDTGEFEIRINVGGRMFKYARSVKMRPEDFVMLGVLYSK